MTNLDINSVVRFVDDWQDNDPKTRDSCAGKVFGHKLVKIGEQIERRWFGRGRVKNVIFVEEGTRNIWYKPSYCNAGVVAMGFSLSRLDFHPSAVSMERYAHYFLGSLGDNPIDTQNRLAWLERNDFKLTTKI